MAATIDDLTAAAEQRWLEQLLAGPTEEGQVPLQPGERAPDLALLDEGGRERQLSELWSDGDALVMFWRHFGCGCGVARAELLRQDWDRYAASGLHPVIVGQGEPERAAGYKAEHGLECPILCDPEHRAYRAFGVGHWPVEGVLFEPPDEFWNDRDRFGASLQEERRAGGRPLVDDPWRASAEFVIGKDGVILHTHGYEHCFDFPQADAQVAGSSGGPTPG